MASKRQPASPVLSAADERGIFGEALSGKFSAREMRVIGDMDLEVYGGNGASRLLGDTGADDGSGLELIDIDAARKRGYEMEYRETATDDALAQWRTRGFPVNLERVSHD